jgi:hypothetical protein
MKHFPTYQATAHTCTLRKAMNLNIPKITKASHPNMRNVFTKKLHIKMILTFSHMIYGPNLS